MKAAMTHLGVVVFSSLGPVVRQAVEEHVALTRQTDGQNNNRQAKQWASHHFVELHVRDWTLPLKHFQIRQSLSVIQGSLKGQYSNEPRGTVPGVFVPIRQHSV